MPAFPASPETGLPAPAGDAYAGRGMPHRGLETFLTVARLKTLKAASVKLHLAQSTVSKRLQMLEHEYGLVLFERGKGGKEVALTLDGERFVGIAERMLDLVYEARHLGGTRSRLSVAVGAVASMNAIIFPALYTRILEREPNAHLTVVTLHSGEMYDEIDARRSDMAFSLLERAHPSVAVRPCFSEPMFGIRLAGGGREHMARVALESLDPGEEIYFPWTPMYQIWHYEWYPASAARVNLDDPYLLVSLLRRPSQWAIVPLSVARHFQAAGKYQIFSPLPEPPDRVCFELTHKHPRARTREALDMVRRHLRAVLIEDFGPARDGRSLRVTGLTD